MLLVVLSVVLCLVSVHQSTLLEDRPDLQLISYNNEIEILLSLLDKECPEYIQQKRKVTDLQGLYLELKASHLQHLTQQLLKCRQDKVVSTTSMTTASVTFPPVPAECLTATNLTQSWRLDHSGSNIRGGGPHSGSNGYACDRRNMGWFRFTGAAGTHMLDTCPKWYSCGTAYPYWTDETPPQAVGVTANISVYGVYSDNCKLITLPMQVMRCSLSTDHDLIYKYIGGYVTGTCNDAFCGMN